MLSLKEFKEFKIESEDLNKVNGGKIIWKGEREYSDGYHNICDIEDGGMTFCNVIDDY